MEGGPPPVKKSISLFLRGGSLLGCLKQCVIKNSGALGSRKKNVLEVEKPGAALESPRKFKNNLKQVCLKQCVNLLEAARQKRPSEPSEGFFEFSEK